MHAQVILCASVNKKCYFSTIVINIYTVLWYGVIKYLIISEWSLFYNSRENQWPPIAWVHLGKCYYCCCFCCCCYCCTPASLPRRVPDDTTGNLCLTPIPWYLHRAAHWAQLYGTNEYWDRGVNSHLLQPAQLLNWKWPCAIYYSLCYTFRVTRRCSKGLLLLVIIPLLPITLQVYYYLGR